MPGETRFAFTVHIQTAYALVIGRCSASVIRGTGFAGAYHASGRSWLQQQVSLKRNSAANQGLCIKTRP